MQKIVFRISLAAVGIGILGFWLAYWVLKTEFPDVGVLKTRFPAVSYRGKNELPQIHLQKIQPKAWTSLSAISKAAIGAIIVSEDWAFYQHKGYDPNQIREALKEDWEERRFSRGASTITQQVVRNVFLDKDKNLWRKLKEVLLATVLEEKVGKKKILEIYLNIAEWGEGIFGIGAASQFYFEKKPIDLTAKEGAFLAMLLPSPKRYGQSFRDKHLTHYASETVQDILEKMERARYLTEEQREMESKTPLSFEKAFDGEEKPPSPLPTPVFLDKV